MLMDSLELTEYELFASALNDLGLQDDEMSIRNAINEYGLDKFPRDRLEFTAAKNILELKSLIDLLKPLRKRQTDLISNFISLTNQGKARGLIEQARLFDKKKGGDAKSRNDPNSKAIREIKKNWEALKENGVHLARGDKQSFLDDELKRYVSLELDRKHIENQLKY